MSQALPDVSSVVTSEGTGIRHRFEKALRAGGIGTWRWDIRRDVVDWDASMEELFGFAPGAFDGTYETYASRLHPEDRPALEARVREVLQSRSPVYRAEYRVVLPTTGVRWFSSVAHLVLGQDGEPAELIGVAADVTDRHQTELERNEARRAEGEARSAMEEATRRLRLLARVSGLLDGPLDLDAMLQQVAELAVHELADWCTVDVVGRGRVHHAAVAHRDPAMVARVREMQDRYPMGLDDPGLAQLLTSLEPMHVPDLTPELLRQSARGDEHYDLLRCLDLGSYVAVPLVANERAVGAMLLASVRGRPMLAEDVELAVDLGRRAGIAVHKTRVLADLADTARTLQASLLPPAMPQIPGLGLSSHFRSGTEGVAIGGDFYDVFRTGADRWWVVLGDVCGKGAGAASLAAAARYSVRAIAPDTDDPAVLVRRLNDVLIAGEWGERFTTLVAVTFQASASPDAPLEASLVLAGHPPALLRRASGEVTPEGDVGTLLGILPEVEVHVTTVRLAAGDTLLLYTDGATEARDAQGDELGVQTLSRLLSFGTGVGVALAGSLAARLAEHAVAGFRDDLALLSLTRRP